MTNLKKSKIWSWSHHSANWTLMKRMKLKEQEYLTTLKFQRTGTYMANSVGSKTSMLSSQRTITSCTPPTESSLMGLRTTITSSITKRWQTLNFSDKTLPKTQLPRCQSSTIRFLTVSTTNPERTPERNLWWKAVNTLPPLYYQKIATITTRLIHWRKKAWNNQQPSPFWGQKLTRRWSKMVKMALMVFIQEQLIPIK